MQAGHTIGAAIAITLAAAPGAALAQRVEENATTQADDAFGRSVGNERSGLYGFVNVRGFNPIEAGNARLQGLYFDLIDRISNRLLEGNTVRVGLAAQRYPFPAPTGLIDYKLRVPSGKTEFGLEVDNASANNRGPSANFYARLPLDGERLAVALAAGGRNVTSTEGSKYLLRNYSALVAFRPAPGTEFLAFTSRIFQRDEEAEATFFPLATSLPPKIERGRFIGLDWTSQDTDIFVHGATARAPLAKGLRLEAGLFQSSKVQDMSFSDLFLGVTPDGQAADRVVIASANDRVKSLSGEVRLVREWTSGMFTHTLTASLRGRSKDRLFGGTQRLSLGGGSITATSGWSQPAYTLPAKNEDQVRQLSGGIAYSLLWQKGLSLDFGISKTSYRKAVNFADPLLADPVSRDNPVLWNMAGSYALTGNLYVYGGMTRGLEDAPIAPNIATNRSEAPPAARTKQAEAGLRLALPANLVLVAGVFSISKPYFSLDPSLRFRQLGTLTNRGLEFSLTGRPAPGLTVLAGTMLLDPRIAGEDVNSGLIGPRPVGQIRRRSVFNLDWRMQGGKGPLSLDLAFESLSSRMANSANTLSAPARTNLNLGARYRFNLGKLELLLRPQLTNAFNNYGWQVSSSGGFGYTPPRAMTMSVDADF